MTGELAKLIAVASQANNGRSQRQAAEIAARRGAPISKSSIAKAIAGRYETITAALVQGIAAGYNLTEEDVLIAMAADMGFHINSYDPSPEAALRRDPSLNADMKAVLLAGLNAARHRKPASSDDTELTDWGLLGGESVADGLENGQ